MALIRPFKALRPHEKVAHLVASVPYDVVNREEAAELAKGNPLSFLRVTRAEIEMPSDIDVYSSEVYAKAKENLERLKNEAPLAQDERPHIYLYRLIREGNSQIGLAATFSVDEYEQDIIKKHEKTRKVKEDDRTNHIVTTRAQTGPVFLTYKGVDVINDAVNQIIQNEKPVYDFKAADGVRHTVWIAPDNKVDIIVEAMKKVDSLYIADGHHRAASAARARKTMMENNPAHTGNEDYNFFLAVLFPAEQLKIMPYNRAVHKLNMPESEFLEKVKINFEVEETDNPAPQAKRNYCMYLSGKWYSLKPNANVKPGNTVGDNLDVSILQNYLLHPVLGIEDPRTDTNIDFIGGIRGTEELVRLVDSGKAEVAFSLYPVSIDDLINISDAGEIMPPKSTWFEPKLRDGLLVHLI
ncbi:hypothetical protein MROS_0722 [Melioribacter roseus P3M-2]|uniref:DUF1015 domain-containing protein n=1 Tax=Melioribacter roseus (strain DSM 23840 / JCM 17771 / VKM B-2668 / P3M-2) TaxID=1191523 RepID=I6ZPL3_MELRP|nr:DUF1015 family protein [Melioribacter roseus]AFN73964.1 hypothetical protein MROS_0722 [Melioribacter roseus P3M-2]